jgi:NADPH2:quinone reductase
MKAIVVHGLGGPEVLALGTHPVPEPGPDQVLVRLEAVGVNFSDTERRRGIYDPPALPWIPGNEAAGVVEAVGDGVDRGWLGRRVAFWAMRTSGTYAEYTVAPVNALFALLDGIEMPVAAALPAQGLTAHGLAHFATALSPGQTALVHAAAGGVGVLLVQLLLRRGVTVFGTASSESKRELIRELGATPLPYGPDSVTLTREHTDGRGLDAVFDSVGRTTQAESLSMLGLYGQLVFFGAAGGSPAPIHPDELYPRNLRVSSFWLAADPPERWNAARHELQELVLAGRLRVTVGQSFALADAAEAHRRLEQRQTHGKLILLPAA